MDYVPDDQSAPPSHFEYTVPTDKDKAAYFKAQALLMMDHLTGWCSKDKGGVLFDLVIRYQPKVVVEIGVFGGKSVVPMAMALKANGFGMLYGIDPWSSQQSTMWLEEETNKEWWTTVDHEGILKGLIDRIHAFELEDQIQLVRASSEEAPLIEGIDILHIDGNHSEESSYFDVTKWVPLVKKRGLIILDDVHWNENGKYTTAKAVSWLDEHCTKMAEFSEQCGWAIWVKR